MQAIMMIITDARITIISNRLIINPTSSYVVKLRMTICEMPAKATVNSPTLMSQKYIMAAKNMKKT